MTYSNEVHLFVGFTPYHAFFSEKIIDSRQGKVFCLFTKGWPLTCRRYHRLGFFLANKFLFRQITYILSFLFFALYCKVFLFRHSAINLYIPHPGSIFSNYLAFSKKIKSIYIYEDGLLNYYDASADKVKIDRLSRILSSLCGMPYKKYFGHLAGYDALVVKGVFLSHPNLAVSKHRIGVIVKIEPAEIRIKPVKGRVLFLDQKIDNWLSIQQRNACMSKMLTKYPNTNYTYYYKKHHDYNGDSLSMHRLPRKLQNIPAEKVIVELAPEIVISFNSSALLNIVQICPAIKCVSTAAAFLSISRDGNAEPLSVLFRHAGIECFDNQ